LSTKIFKKMKKIEKKCFRASGVFAGKEWKVVLFNGKQCGISHQPGHD
jgi:hypothetical protein